MKSRTILVLALMAWCAAQASAGILLFGKKSRSNPKERVPELIAVVKTDGDERKRMDAAEELKQYDPAAFPEIVPVLIDVLLNDKKPSVRAEAARSLGKIRPVSQSAGLALEDALSKDASMSVRLQARSALFGYRWAGYKSVKKDEPLIPNKESAVAESPEKATPMPPRESEKIEEPFPRSFIRKAKNIQRMTPRAQPASQQRTIEPPPIIAPVPGAKPLPVGPVNPPARTGEPPLAPTNSGVGSQDGPSLDP